MLLYRLSHLYLLQAAPSRTSQNLPRLQDLIKNKIAIKQPRGIPTAYYCLIERDFCLLFLDDRFRICAQTIGRRKQEIPDGR